MPFFQCGLSKQKSKALETGDDVLISGFGKFSVKKKALRMGIPGFSRQVKLLSVLDLPRFLDWNRETDTHEETGECL